MKTYNYTIRGKVLNLATEKAIPGLRVEAWDKDLIANDLLGNATTDSDGIFSISFSTAFYKELFLDNNPDIFFKVFEGETLLYSSECDVLWDIKQADTVVTLKVPVKEVTTVEPVTDAVVQQLALLAGASASATATLASLGIRYENITKTVLASLLAKGVIDDKLQSELLLVIAFHRLSNENFALTKALKNNYTSLRSLVKLTVPDWLQFLKKHKIIALNGMDEGAYADKLAGNIAKAFPSDWIVNRLVHSDKQSSVNKITDVNPLLANNTALFENGKVAQNLNWEGIAPAEKEKMMAGLNELNDLVNTYKHLDIAIVLHNRKTSVTDKIKAINTKLNSLNAFAAANPDLDLRFADFFSKNEGVGLAPKWNGVPEGEKRFVKKQLMSFQRVLLLSHEPDIAEKLLTAGYDSATTISVQTPRKLSSNTGVSDNAARSVIQRANEITLRSSHALELVREIADYRRTATRAGNLSPALVNELKDIDGYDKMFGLQNYCSCDQCKSIFSPAAYFVDLMYFIENKVDGITESDSIHLKNRRKDLWELELSCENTNGLVSYLSIVNAALEKQIAGTSPYQALANTTDTLDLPFHLPLAEIRTYLKHFNLTLSDVSGIVNPDSMHPEILGISLKEWELITIPNMINPEKIFGITNGVIPLAFEVTRFLKLTKLKRDELSDLLLTDYVKSNGIAPEIIREQGDDIQEYTEVIVKLDKHNLDRIARFTRLWRKTDWTIKELDLVIGKLAASGTDAEPDFNELLRLVALRRKLNVSIEEVSGLFSTFSSDYIRLFLGDDIFDVLPVEKKETKLIAWLKIPMPDLAFLTQESELKADLASAKEEYMYRLYRYVKLSKKLNYGIQEFNEVLKLWGKSITGGKMEIANLLELVEFAGKIRQLPFKAAKAVELINGNELLLSDDEAINKLKEFISAIDPSESPVLTKLKTDMQTDSGAGLVKFKEYFPEIKMYLVLATDYKLSSESLTFLLDDFLTTTDQYVFFNANKKLNTAVLFSLTVYNQLLSVNNNVSQLRKLLLNPVSTGLFSTFFNLPNSLVENLVQEIQNGDVLKLPAPPLQSIDKLLQYISICVTAGINGSTLTKLVSDNYDSLQAAGNSLLASFRSKYEDEKAFNESLSTHTDELDVLKRDALAAYIISNNTISDKGFETYDDLYEYFLLDVEMDGCARTSKVLAAISSLQLYIHRVLMNLEQTANEVAVLKEEVRAEWEWRKNYRIWEANRKVFLYPENYIEPDLRDNKSPEFKELEEELLQQKITKEAAANAYKKYLTQFSQLSRLIIAGNYYHKDVLTGEELYYFFGRTNTDPYQYYYRTYEPNSKVFSSWTKIELAINAPYISAIKHLGRLFIFWVEKSIVEQTIVNAGNTSRNGYEISFKIVYSDKNEFGKWRNPQKLSFKNMPIQEALKLKYETSKTYQKCYPIIVDETIYILARTPIHATESIAYPDAFKLDLYSNKLEPYNITYNSTIDSDPIKVMDVNTTTSQLVAVNTFPSNSYYLYTYNDVYIDELYIGNFGSMNYYPITQTAEVGDKKIGIKVNESLLVHNKSDESIISLSGIITENNISSKLNTQQYLIRSANLTNNWPAMNDKREVVHLSTMLADTLGKEMFNHGIDEFLSITTQQNTDYNINQVINHAFLTTVKYDNFILPFNGPYGEYYKELFFHIPFLIANHLNATGKYPEAKYWYEKIFNPTATPVGNIHSLKDVKWQYILFRNLGTEKMSEILIDTKAIETYKKDPFNPHAIARLRLNAYQKSIVMKYIDNLLDWGDSLFSQDTVESINEATMLYILAKDILGEKPADSGKCETAADELLTYSKIGPAINEYSEFLIALENYQNTTSNNAVIHASGVSGFGSDNIPTAPNNHSSFNWNEELEPNVTNGISFINPGAAPHLLAFCVPPNTTLLTYWDRVDDRLFKIRHCMDINGLKRKLPLFQPPIDPMVLARAKAAGLSLSDILRNHDQELPAYRFTYLIEKARQFTGTLQGFGSALLSALEKKDVEELTLIRSVHEQNILALTKEIKKKNIEDAQAQLQGLLEAKKNVENRIVYYTHLIDEGLTGMESLEQDARHAANIITTGLPVFAMTSAIAGSGPRRVGFSISPGFEETANGAIGAYQFMRTISDISSGIANSAAIEAGNFRREQEWKQQIKLSKQELKQMEQQIVSGEIRLALAEKDLELHTLQTEQTKELSDFYKGKFSNLGLYDYLSGALSSLYRSAYNMAFEMALKAQNAYLFEQDVTNSSSIINEGGYWQTEKAGLLSGEKLMLQLQQLEVAYMEKNVRNQEITQTFSLAQLSPQSLDLIRKEGTATLNIPEFAFDMVYPGQYKRIIKSVRITIPCVTGPYTNVNAKLTLNSSYIRRKVGEEISSSLENLSVKNRNFISTSNAVNDGGVFELNFRDERYLPFEGAGAISAWELKLPKDFRSFDYTTITDVLIHISYTASWDGNLADQITERLKNEFQFFRIISVKDEFSNEWYEAKNNSISGSNLTITINKKTTPVYLANQTEHFMKYTILGSGVENSYNRSDNWIVDIGSIADKDNVFVICMYSITDKPMIPPAIN